MIKRLLTAFIILSSAIVSGQDNSSSPYSYFGVGLPSFNGSVESRAMEGLSIYADSTSYNFQNPAALGELKLTTFTIGLTEQLTTLKNGIGDSEKAKNTSVDYMAVAIPTGKLNFAIGLNPKNAVGYKFQEVNESSLGRFKGEGGLNNLFLALGYQITKNLRAGVEGSYHFGSIKNTSSFYQDGIQYGTRERSRSDLSGTQFKFGIQYQKEIQKDIFALSSITYTPKTSLNSKNERFLGTSILGSNMAESIVKERKIEMPNTEFDLPSELRVGLGVTKFQKWMIGLEYENIGTPNYNNTTFNANNVIFKKANIYRLGGFYIPNFNDNNYLNRVTYRAGVRYQESGLNINNQDIKEFGMSFGLGLPAGPYLSHFNIGAEYGQRGTTSAGLVKENFVNIFIGLTFNDKWFNKRKFN